ncbi:MAG: Cof-type HAD-IIB family hydrolase [Actinobacteria bacterium]|nr:Cof-type HAD-IIB family hydrolase [Actinomycetota bacterium]
MIKIIATDVDGTLLDNNSEISELNGEALFTCKEKNIGIILATGKSIFSIKPIIKEFNLKLPQITLNGAVVFDSKFRVIHSIRILPETYRELIIEIRKHSYNPLVALKDGRIIFDKHHAGIEVFKKVKEKMYKVSSIETGFISQNCVSVSIAIKETDPFEAHLRNKFSDRLQLVRSGEYFFDILNLNATKGSALHSIAEDLNIKKEEIAVFGDSFNDLSMFEYAGLRFAVKNSYKKVLEKADYIIEENYNSGLGKAIFKYILNS